MKDLEIGRRIRVVRNSYGLTQVEFATEIGKAPGYVSLLEKGNIYSIDILTTICERFSIDEIWLRTGSGSSLENSIISESIAPGIGERIRSLRTRVGLTQLQFAELLSYAASTIAGIEASEIKPRPDLLLEISQQMNIPLEYLIHGKDLPDKWLPPADVLSDEAFELVSLLLSHRDKWDRIRAELITPDDATSIGSMIKQARKKKGWTQQQLADMTGLGRKTIISYERSSTLPSDDVLRRIIEALEITAVI